MLSYGYLQGPMIVSQPFQIAQICAQRVASQLCHRVVQGLDVFLLRLDPGCVCLEGSAQRLLAFRRQPTRVDAVQDQGADLVS